MEAMLEEQRKLHSLANTHLISWLERETETHSLTKGKALRKKELTFQDPLRRYGDKIDGWKCWGTGDTSEEAALEMYGFAFQKLATEFGEPPVRSAREIVPVLIDYTEKTLVISFRDDGKLRTLTLEKPESLFSFWLSSDVVGDEKLCTAELRFESNNIKLGD